MLIANLVNFDPLQIIAGIGVALGATILLLAIYFTGRGVRYVLAGE